MAHSVALGASQRYCILDWTVRGPTHSPLDQWFPESARDDSCTNHQENKNKDNAASFSVLILVQSLFSLKGLPHTHTKSWVVLSNLRGQYLLCPFMKGWGKIAFWCHFLIALKPGNFMAVLLLTFYQSKEIKSLATTTIPRFSRYLYSFDTCYQGRLMDTSVRFHYEHFLKTFSLYSSASW